MHTPLSLPLLPDHGSLCAGRCCVRKCFTAAGLPQWDRGDSANARIRGESTGRSGKKGNPSTGNSFITEKMSSMKKCNKCHFCTLNRLHILGWALRQLHCSGLEWYKKQEKLEKT